MGKGQSKFVNLTANQRPPKTLKLVAVSRQRPAVNRPPGGGEARSGVIVKTR